MAKIVGELMLENFANSSNCHIVVMLTANPVFFLQNIPTSLLKIKGQKTANNQYLRDNSKHTTDFNQYIYYTRIFIYLLDIFNTEKE